MKKIILILLFLSGCLLAPEKMDPLGQEEALYSVPANEVTVVSMAPSFDALPHVEKRLPLPPDEAVSLWVKKYVQTAEEVSDKLVIVIHQADVLLEEKKAPHWFDFDREIYTLTYHLEVQLRHQTRLIKKSSVRGKGFVDVAKKASLATKEKNWNQLIQKMLIHLKTQIKADFNNDVR